MSVTSLANLATWADEPFGHPALFYRGLDEYLTGTLPFIAEGLAASEPVAVAVPASRLEPLRAELGEAAARVRFVDMGEAGRNPGRIIPCVLLAFADAHRDAGRMRIVGEPIWPGRSDVEYPACVQHEALINMAFAGQAVTILCPYDVEGLPAAVLADAEATHPAVIDAGGVRVSTRYAADRIFAEHNRPFPDPSQPQTVLPSPLSPSHARRAAVEQARRAGLAPDRIADLELAINELVTDSVEDGAMPALRFWLQDGHLVAELRVAGDLDDPLVGRRPVDPHQTRGRGLLLVNQLADLVRIHSVEQHTTIRMYLTVMRRTAPGRPGATELRDAMSAADTASFMIGDGTSSRIHRPEIHQAIGMVLTQLGVSATDAFARLWAYAVTEQRLLKDVAVDVVSRRLRFTSSTHSPGSAVSRR